MKTDKRIVIIGAGLSGLTLAYTLKKKGINATILEAADRPGGRIHTQIGVAGTPLELGATWFSDQHPQMIALLQELHLQKFPQFSEGISLFLTKSFEPPQQFFIPAGEAPSYRITGGTEQLIKTLQTQIPADRLLLNTKVTAIKERPENLLIITENGNEFEADIVISCMPPKTAVSLIEFSPALPEDVRSILHRVQTWMAGAIKFVLEFESPFWRKKGFSGMLFSHTGIISEMYDHTNATENRFGFTGFLNGATAVYSQEERKVYVIKQLQDLLGEDVLRMTAYYDKVWVDEDLLYSNSPDFRPHQYNGHPVLHEAYLNNRFYFCGTETAALHPGYMEGAVLSAITVAEKLNMQ
ncbi:flavin monoamine oxidase family protein [Chitinophaga pinensis]|uniref:Amine oxidase n=1 Tax=Chitinophaga pinensis (strain ATCC 43595 / DSM 2588 / LMG 13176 / NBRC 15968 / NCIMB 11800 / UQM 2034) TaxID=485918 RepID=A0A979G9K8_CHIPD|nr:NAD(P)/FAD-dependent oxidoreductase [Chitinophaga pinensis]ACU63459.1 amine oxidase [Chitinophaga pinensis DSM 2588]